MVSLLEGRTWGPVAGVASVRVRSRRATRERPAGSEDRLADTRGKKPCSCYPATTSRFRSMYQAHGTNSHAAKPTPMSAFTLGGGGEKRSAT